MRAAKMLGMILALVLGISVSFGTAYATESSKDYAPPSISVEQSNEADVDQSIVQVGTSVGGEGGSAECFDCVAAAGNGGTADADANGGAISVGDINSGFNTGNVIVVEYTWYVDPSCGCWKYGAIYGSVYVHGGEVSNSTTLNISADGGTAIADASGGDDNVAVLSVHGGDGGDGGDINQDATNTSVIVQENTISGGLPRK